MIQCSIEKRCSCCHKIYPATAEYFHRNKNKKDGFQNQCKKCKSIVDTAYRLTSANKAAQKKYRVSEKGKVVTKNGSKRYEQSPKGKSTRREQKYKNRYGVAIKWFNKMFRIQKGRCAICGVHQSLLIQRLHVDHNHKTNKVRELLCLNCNRGLGYFKDSAKLLKMAADYLEKHLE